jgi:hypothetical protein
MKDRDQVCAAGNIKVKCNAMRFCAFPCEDWCRGWEGLGFWVARGLGQANPCSLSSASPPFRSGPDAACPTNSPLHSRGQALPNMSDSDSQMTMTPSPDEIADCVLTTFDSLPAKCKPRQRESGSREWIPLSGIVLSRGMVAPMLVQLSPLFTCMLTESPAR